MSNNKHIKLPKRKSNSHKGDYGRVLIVAGSPGMTGAAVLASRGALRSGAGLVYLAVPTGLVNFVDSITPEVITIPFEKIKDIREDALLIGPGLGQSPSVRKLVDSLITKTIGHLVIDADALNIISDYPKILKKAKTQIVITPHPGEMSRLIHRRIEYIQKNRAVVAREAARLFHCLVVLKGHKTVVAEPHGETYINSTGNPGMATAGVGDVLGGMIASFIAQGQSVWHAAIAGVYLHGLAGDLAAKEKGQHGMIASDLVERIPDAIQRVY
ncbi:NAD(P)H-hydrate dehydratase [Candidatus Margulisiibacteriota bacterium]